MTAPNQSTCSPWADVGDVCSPCNDYEMDVVSLADWIQVASDILFDLTRRRWPGICTTTVRPCGYRTEGWCGCHRPASCSCRSLSEVRLPGPIVSIGTVKLDGAILAPARYRVDDHRLLVYIPDGDDDPRRGWPCCQRLELPDTEDETWSITYDYGGDPPLGGLKSAAALGCQFTIACDPEAVDSGLCRLPARVVNEVRQGVTIALSDPSALIADGLTGLDEVDHWVSSVNRGAAMRPARFWSPGHARAAVRRTNT